MLMPGMPASISLMVCVFWNPDKPGDLWFSEESLWLSSELWWFIPFSNFVLVNVSLVDSLGFSSVRKSRLVHWCLSNNTKSMFEPKMPQILNLAVVIKFYRYLYQLSRSKLYIQSNIPLIHTFFWGWNWLNDNSRKVWTFLLLLAHTPPKCCALTGVTSTAICGLCRHSVCGRVFLYIV